MAEQVNKRIEDMINELEQMQRTELYTNEEIREISRKRKDFEYKIQRHTKHKEDYTNYIAYEIALLEDISLRRKQVKCTEKKQDIEYAITKRLNRVFKQMISRFQNDIEVYFQYIKFCQSVGFVQAVSGVIGQMLQIYGDKPKMWQMAAKWEKEEQNNLENARNFLLKGVHRHPTAEILYLDLFKIELLLAFSAEEDDERDKQLKRADIIWRNGLKNIDNVNFLFKIFEISMKYDFAQDITNNVKNHIWSYRHKKDAWSYIARMELNGDHWVEIEDIINEDSSLPTNLNNFMSVYEEGLVKFSDVKLCTKYIHELLNVTDDICTETEKIEAVKQAWIFGHQHGLLSNDMYEFGIELLKLENFKSDEDIIDILDEACKKNPTAIFLWKEKLVMHKQDDKKMCSILQDAGKVLQPDDMVTLWNILLDNITSNDMVKIVHKKIQNCESSVFLSIKPKLLQKTYEYCGIKAARELYNQFIRTPPIQREIHTVMINIEKCQSSVSYKQLKKCYECLVQHHGADHCDIWLEYMAFETESGHAQLAPNIYRQAVAALKKEIVDDFIKAHALSKLK